MRILAMPFNSNVLVQFDPIGGNVLSDQPIPPDVRVSGNAHRVDGHWVALFAGEDGLYLSIDQRRWPLADRRLRLSYRHDVPAQKTIFSIDDGIRRTDLVYPAWWKGLGQDILSIPEMDEDEDYLAYVVAVWKNAALQASLLKTWNQKQSEHTAVQ